MQAQMERNMIETINPATGEKIAAYPLIAAEKAMDTARKANDVYRHKWSVLGVSDRASYIGAIAKSLRAKKAEYAKIITQEMGKPIVQSEIEIEKCAWTAEVLAKNGEEWLKDDPAETNAENAYVTFQPLGVVLGVMPWNFPFWQALRAAMPAMLAGNTFILRHSNTCPACALAIEESILNAGFPDGVLQTIISSHETIDRLIGSDFIRGVTFTGSVEAGKSISDLAGKNLKKFVLELGGSDPFIVLEDANIDEAAWTGAVGRLLNSGQSCDKPKRFIVVKKIAEEFTRGFVDEIQKLKVGDPMERTTDVGPLVNKEAVERVDGQVKDALSKGAKALLRGGPRSGKGSFYDPTVLSDVNRSMKVMNEEVFGPAAPIYIVENEEDAIRIANETSYGLGASIWTENLEKAGSLASQIESGTVFVNCQMQSDPRLPFGGIKNSGIGRELSAYGLKEFVNVKAVQIFKSQSQETAVVP
jgi:acyl-CoA reductase-like NAD-dependent aldehyde dehydrogenase